MLRFVPVEGSLSDNAPRYGRQDTVQEGGGSVSRGGTDYPGGSGDVGAAGDLQGPLCWKCDGAGSVRVKSQWQPKPQSQGTQGAQGTGAVSHSANKEVQEVQVHKACGVCGGKSRMAVKRKLLQARSREGEVTVQSAPEGWVPWGPPSAYGISV
mmetsp:Transcript_8573/g.19601  ORF Transcript_8573/g.19601 Transcript_8573/m.19601 type:complete len:154 (-) Transcript_8573:78-539(-)